MDHTDDTWMQVLDLSASMETLADEILADDILGRFLTEEAAVECEPLKANRETTYQKRKHRRIDEIRKLRRAVEELEALRDSLQRGTATKSSQQLTTTECGPDKMWMTVALRQHRRLQASQTENEQLLAEVIGQEALVQQLASLVLCAPGNDSFEVPCREPASHVSPDNVAAFLQLTKMSSSMLATVDTVFDDQKSPEEFQILAICHPNASDIAMGSMIATMTANRFVPHSREAINDCLWAYEVNDATAALRVQLLHQDRCDQTQRIYFQVHLPTDQGVCVFHGVGVGLRCREASRDVLVSSWLVSPDATTESPWNAISLLLRDWVVLQPLASGHLQQMRSKSQTFRFAHSHAPDHLTLDEAATLQVTAVRALQRVLSDKNDRIDDLLLTQRPLHA